MLEERLPHDSRVMTVPLPQSRLTYSSGEEGHSFITNGRCQHVRLVINQKGKQQPSLPGKQQSSLPNNQRKHNKQAC